MESRSPFLSTLKLKVQPALSEDNPIQLDSKNLSMVDRPDLEGVGITLKGGPSAKIYVTQARTVGDLRLDIRGANALVIVDTNHRGDRINGNIRIAGNDCICLLSSPDYGVATLNVVSMRSDNQTFYWGRGATAVGLSVEIEGDGRSVLVGDDALISSSVWIRNHDMHSIIDLNSGAVTNSPPVDTVIEPHVWIGQEALLLTCTRVGYGSIIGAKSLVRGEVPSTSVASGIPARVLRNDSSWSRAISGFSPAEGKLLQRLATMRLQSLSASSRDG